MRILPRRPALPEATLAKLKVETVAIKKSADRKAEAKRRYDNARKCKWFQPVINSLKQMAGEGGRCMYCSGSEASDVDHYRPKATYPQYALIWKNLLWSCSICNRNKNDRFPSQTEGMLIDPTTEDPWKFFFIDDYGLLTPRYDKSAGAIDARAQSTRDIFSLNRQAVQESRRRRILDLKRQVADCLEALEAGRHTAGHTQHLVADWVSQPFQPDVADYFLRGPGRSEEPFRSLLERIPVDGKGNPTRTRAPRR